MNSWFQTAFNVPSAWQGNNIIINFGAVDNEATVYVNVSLDPITLPHHAG